MAVVTILIFVSLLLVGGSMLLLFHAVKQRDFDHGERLSLLPLAADDNVQGAEFSKDLNRTAPIHEGTEPS